MCKITLVQQVANSYMYVSTEKINFVFGPQKGFHWAAILIPLFSVYNTQIRTLASGVDSLVVQK